MTNNIENLFKYINEAAQNEQNQKIILDNERLRLEREEEEVRLDYITKIKEFFRPLYRPFTYMVDVYQYQTLQHYPYLFIYSGDEIVIWGSNLEEESESIPFEDLLENWKYDFVQALYVRLEEILLQLAIKHGYEKNDI